MKKSSTNYAAEGTVAHRLAEICLQDGSNPQDHIGEYITVPAESHSKLSASGAKRWISCPGSLNLAAEEAEEENREDAEAVVTKEMAEAVAVYVDLVNEESKDSFLSIEKKFDLGWLVKDLGGKSDCYIHNSETKTLRVYDYKHGKGVVVDPEFNEQLMIYAIAALKDVCKFDKNINMETVEEIELIIVQPRAVYGSEPVKRWTINPYDLMFWAMNVLLPAAHKAKQKNAPLIAGEHCRFCKAISYCSEMQLAISREAQVSFEKAENAFLEPGSMEVEKIAKVLDLQKSVTAWMDAIKERAYELLEQGVKVPGYKLVKKKADRAWKDETKAIAALSVMLPDEAIYEKKFLSVAKAEKLLKDKKLLDGLWEKPDTGTAIAPVSDSREEVKATSAEVAFLSELDVLQ